MKQEKPKKILVLFILLKNKVTIFLLNNQLQIYNLLILKTYINNFFFILFKHTTNE